MSGRHSRPTKREQHKQKRFPTLTNTVGNKHAKRKREEDVGSKVHVLFFEFYSNIYKRLGCSLAFLLEALVGGVFYQ